MTINNEQFVDNKQTTAANTPESVYTSPAEEKGSLVTNFTAVNSTAVTRSYKAYIVTSGGSPVIPFIIMNVDYSFCCLILLWKPRF